MVIAKEESDHVKKLIASETHLNCVWWNMENWGNNIWFLLLLFSNRKSAITKKTGAQTTLWHKGITTE